MLHPEKKFVRANQLVEGEDSGTIVSHPGEYWMKLSFDSEESWQKVCILKGRRKLTPPSDIDCPIMYPYGHPINPKKVADFQNMIPYLPSSRRDFFRCRLITQFLLILVKIMLWIVCLI